MGLQMAGGPQVRDFGDVHLSLSALNLSSFSSGTWNGWGAGSVIRMSVVHKGLALTRDEQGDGRLMYRPAGRPTLDPACSREQVWAWCESEGGKASTMRHQHCSMKDQSWVVGRGKLESGRHCMDGRLGWSPDLSAKQKGRERER